MDQIRLRPARQEDAAALQRLNADMLGYDYSLSDTQEQLHRLLAMPQHVGYVHAQDYEVLYSSPMKDILGIAVHPDYQHQGIGSSLLAWIEQWASSQNACMIRLVSSEARVKAHAFYEANGYLREKRQLNFKKMI